MGAGHNLWVNRFDGILGEDEIKRLANRPARALFSLEKETIEHACTRIESELGEIFVTTTRLAQILRKFVEHAHSHSLSRYPDVRSFLRRCYDNMKDIDPYFPHILTGPPGTGKTQLGRALMRVLPQPSVIQPDANHPQFPLVTAQHISIRSIKSLSGILQMLARPKQATSTNNSIDNTPALACARWQYACGTSMLITDELQFITRSAQASTRITEILLGLTYVLLPTLFIANYSLVHKLCRRPYEERQRLLGRPLILLLPDLPSSEDWIAVLKEYQCAVPGVYQFDFAEKQEELWSLCAGLKRELIKLLVLAYQQCRVSGNTQVGWDDIELAYLSSNFFLQRTDIEASIAYASTGKKVREDLRCPIPVDPSAEDAYQKALSDVRRKKVNDQISKDSMSKSEQDAIAQLTATSTSGRNSPRKPKAKKCNLALSAEALMANAEKHLGQAKK